MRACQVGFEEVHNVVGEGKRVAQEGVIAFDEHAFEPEVHFIHESDSRCLFVHSDLESQQGRLFVVQEQPRLQYGGKHWVYGALVVDLDRRHYQTVLRPFLRLERVECDFLDGEYRYLFPDFNQLFAALLSDSSY